MEQGIAKAQYELAEMYDFGVWTNTIGREAKRSLAIYWYTKSGEQGYTEAQFELAKMYYNGEGTTMNKKLAAFWMKKSYKKGHEDAKEA